MLLDFINPLVRDVDGIDEDPNDEARIGLPAHFLRGSYGGLRSMRPHQTVRPGATMLARVLFGSGRQPC
jgi:hypothetical protein